MKKGFTIVEMLMVIAVLAILMGIITTVASSAIKEGRSRKTEAMRSMIETGIATYYAKYEEWPGSRLQEWSRDGVPESETRRSNASITDAKKKLTGHTAHLNDEDFDDVMRTIVKASVGSGSAAPIIDPTGLFVASQSVASRRDGFGRDFKEAIKKGNNRNRLSISQMVFGYPDKDTGHFRRFKAKYNSDSDSLTVEVQ